MTKTAKYIERQAHEVSDTDANDANSALPATAPQRRAGRNWVIGIGAVALAAVAYLAFSSGGSGSEPQTAAGPVNTADVVVADLVQEVSFEGTLGTVEADPVRATTSGIVTAVASPGEVVEQGDTLYRIDDEPAVLLYGSIPAYRDIALGSDELRVAARDAGVITALAPVGSIIEQGDVVYWIDGEPVVALYGTTPMYRTLRDLPTDLVGEDVGQLEGALVDLGFTLDGNLTVDSQFTYGTQLAVQEWQESLGVEADGVVEVGDILFIPGPVQIVEYEINVGDVVNAGVAVATLSSGPPMSGSDVTQLEAALVDQGFDADGAMTVDGVFTAETRDAIVAFQTSVGQAPDGVVNLGDIVFLPASVQIAEQLAATGATVNAGTPVVSLSSVDQVVQVAIPAADRALIEIGEPVIVTLPGFSETPGTVASISATANVTQDGDTFFEAIVELDDPAQAADLDEAPVTVKVVGDAVTGVTAVPVTALIALAEGGYAVEIATGGGYQLVAVEPGFFAEGLVEVTSSDLNVGDTVTLP